MKNLAPIKLKQITKKIIWGGTRLSGEYGLGAPGENIAEAWELTCREDGVNTIEGGSYDGRTLEEYISENKSAVGTKWDGGRFPLLIKLIDAEKDLSIQVHPDDAYAAAHTTDFGKTEMWYIVDAKPGAKIIYGMNGKYTSEEISEAIKSGTLEKMMNYVPVHAGEAYFIPSGLVHAIGAGILIAEIQQNSNITYRVYDYNRKGDDGKLRPLHIDDALAVIAGTDPENVKSEPDEDKSVIAKCKYFTVHKYDLCSEEKEINVGKESFLHVMCVKGKALISSDGKDYALDMGESYFVPAGMGKITVEAQDAQIITSTM
ncbi:MAG: type I phosphomannose isomerase catalytic subunit [Eubacteriales bacterium]